MRVPILSMIIVAGCAACPPIAASAAPTSAASSEAAAASAASPSAATSSASPAPSPWLQSPAVQQRLNAGAVVDRSVVDERHASASIDAAIRVHASPQVLWPLITQCRTAALLLPQLKACKLLQSAVDGSWAVIEHDIKYSLLSPMVHSVFRADYQPPYRMDFHRIRGDLKSEVGSWRLVPSGDGSWTTVEYQVAMQPGFWLPRGMVRRSLRKQLPAALVALRGRAEQSETAPVAAAVPIQGDSPAVNPPRSSAN